MSVSVPESQYRWLPYPALTPAELNELSAYPRILQKLLRVRGICDQREAEIFLTRSGSLYDPLDKNRGMKGMPAAVRMILEAVDRKKRIAVYGDYEDRGAGYDQLYP